MRRAFALALIVLGLLLAFASVSQADTVTLPTSNDTFVRSDQPTSSFGAVNPLHVDGEVVGDPTEPERQSYLRFPGSPSNATSAKLRLHIPFPTTQGFQVRALDCSAWTDASTYKTKPAVGVVLADVPPATANVYNEITLPAPAAGENCYALTKTGNNWMTVSSRESANPPQLVVTFTPPPPLDTDNDGVPDSTDNCPTVPGPASNGGCPIVEPPPSPVAHCSGPTVDVTPGTIRSVLAGRDNVVVRAAPGTYSDIGIYPSAANVKGCLEIRCSSSAKSGDFGRTGSAGCLATGQNDFGAVRNLTVEGFQFVTSEDYGVAIYDESPIVGMKVRFANNVWNGEMFHDISIKENTAYMEVVDNYFISCKSHCWEIGQNGNIINRPNTVQYALFKGNKVSSRTQGVTQRSVVKLDVIGNEFRSVGGYAVITEPYWTLYPYPAPGGLYVPGTKTASDPKVPLRTTVTGNSFSSGNRLYFTGRGVADDVVLLTSNTGTAPSCTRGGMNSRNSGTSAAFVNEETLAAPLLDPASDRSC